MADRLVLNGLMGAIIGKYRVERPLEQGESGAVFHASDKAGARYLMRFIGDLTAESMRDVPAGARLVFLAHFQQEAKLIATLRHSHILPLLDYGNFQSWPYLVYPQLAGNSLLELLSTQSPLPLAGVGQYLQQITSALDYAHQHAVLHRNLSTASISVQPDALQYSGQSASVNKQESFGRLLISEFGYRRIIELSRVDLQADLGGHQRRPAYDGSSETSAPEQLLGQPIDIYTDVYACGVLLYRLLTGHAPFEGATRDEVARQHLYAQVPSVYAWRKDVPGRLNEVLKKALAKDPFQRYRRPGELAQAYQDAMQPLAMPVPTPTEVVSSRLSTARVQQRGKVSRRRVLALVGGTGGGVAAVSILAGMHFLQKQVPSDTSNGVPQATVAQGLPKPARPASHAAGSGVLIRASDLPTNSAMTFPIANQQRPGVLVHLPDKRFVAFDST
ncbi:MAG: serine/threonine protein kinase [Ktedonobacteraceae bacterium]|nr:serine/threonine protein kinase [Ktedonobacteraceae bacterium]